jgi:hemerythrin
LHDIREDDDMFQYTEDCVIGIEELDDDHRHLFELLNRGFEILQEDFVFDKYDPIKNLLEELLDYANTHFAREEGYMAKIRDPELIMQRVQHDHFRKTIWDLDFKDIDTEEEQKAILERTLTFLTEWLYQHIIGSDAMIGKLPPLEEWMIKDNPCEFSEEYWTGNMLIDEEHKMLFAISERVYILLKEGVDGSDAERIIGILRELKEYTKNHFADEEEYMESIGYSGIEAQKRAHRSFISELEDINEDEVRNNTQAYTRSLLEFLLGWLINHILKVDKLIPVKD